MEESTLSPSSSSAPRDLVIRPITAAHRAALSNLLDRAFGLKSGERFLSDFPVWEPGLCRAVTRWGVFSGETLVASAGIRVANLRQASGTSAPVGIVGGVATDPEFQGHGLASRLMTEVTAFGSAKNLSMMVLWGSQHEFYGKYGFELCGVQHRLPLGALQLSEDRASFQLGYCKGIFEARRRHACGLVLTDDDQLWYSRHMNVQWIWTGTPDEVDAYVGIGRGIDLPGMIHEWGGRPDALAALLKSLQAQIPETEILGSSELFSSWQIAAPREALREYLCMAKSLDDVPAANHAPFWFWGLDSA